MIVLAEYGLRAIIEANENDSVNDQVRVDTNAENIENRPTVSPEEPVRQIAAIIINELGEGIEQEIELLRNGSDCKALTNRLGFWIHKQVSKLKNDVNTTWESVAEITFSLFEI